MNETKLAKTLTKITQQPDPETFIYDLLRAYKLPKATITLLQQGDRNTATEAGQVGLKRKLWFRELKVEEDPWLVLKEIKEGLRHKERFIILTDYEVLLAWDTVTEEALDIDLTDLPKHYDFFFPWAGIEKTQHRDENPADVKAASRMARLYDLIKKDNPRDDEHFTHELNVFLSRLLFCYFAEDTGIFPGDNLFTNGIGSQTERDGSNLSGYFTELFNVLDCPAQGAPPLPRPLPGLPLRERGTLPAQHLGAQLHRPQPPRHRRRRLARLGRHQPGHLRLHDPGRRHPRAPRRTGHALHQRAQTS